MKRVLVTGGSGFIGTSICKYLIKEKKVHVLNIHRNIHYKSTNFVNFVDILKDPLYNVSHTDICDKKHISKLFHNFKPDTVIHLAAESHVDKGIADPSSFIDTNIKGTFVMLECAKEYWNTLPEEDKNKFIFQHVSTYEVYGSLDSDNLFTEESRHNPPSPYSACKAAADHLVSAWFHTYKLPIVIARCSTIYGEYQYPEKLIPLIILNALHKKHLPVYGNGQNSRDWLYIQDAVIGLIEIIEKGSVGETYNLGGNNERTTISIVKNICDILDTTKPLNEGSYADLITFIEARLGKDQRYAISTSKIEKELKWSAKEKFETGLFETVKWYIDNEWWWKLIYNK